MPYKDGIAILVNRERTGKIMDKYGLDVLVASKPENVTYMSDFRSFNHQYLGSQVYVVWPKEKEADAAIVLPVGDARNVIGDRLSWLKDIRSYGTFCVARPSESSLGENEQKIYEEVKRAKPQDAIKALTNTLEDKGFDKANIGLDEMNVAFPVWERIKKELPSAKITPSYSVLREIRMVKTEEEVRRLKKSASIIEEAIRTTMSYVKEGVTGQSLVNEFNKCLVENSAYPLFTQIAPGTLSHLSYDQPSKRRLKKGDLLRFDTGCLYKHYCSDVSRTAVLGKSTEKQQRYFKAILRGEQEAIDSIRQGVKASEIFHIALKSVREAGIPHFERHHCGHGIGIEPYDRPTIAPNDSTLLQKNMVLCIETPYYELGLGGLAVEDTIIVTGRKSEYLTKSDREIYSL